jgi:hypothetical protein
MVSSTHFLLETKEGRAYSIAAAHSIAAAYFIAL